MKKIIITVSATLLITSIAYAADQQGGMMRDDMMKTCQSHMQDGKMMDSMPKDMMDQCSQMMKNGGMMKGGMMEHGSATDAPPSDASKSQ